MSEILPHRARPLALLALAASLLASPALRAEDEVPQVDAADDAADDDEAWETLLAPTVRARRVEGAGESAPAVREGRQSVDAERIERRGVRTLDELLDEIPAASIQRPTGTTAVPIIDGLPASFLQITRDGVPFGARINTLEGPSPDIGSIHLGSSDVERVDVRRTVGPDGQGGVVLDVVTRPPEVPRLDVRADVRALPGALTRQIWSGGGASPLGDRTDLELSVEHDRIEPIDVDGDQVFDRPRSRRTAGGLALGRELGTSGSLRTRLDVSHNDLLVAGAEGAPFDDLAERLHVDASTVGRWQPSAAWDMNHTTRWAFSRHRFLKRVRSSGFERLNNETEIHNVLQTVDARRTGEGWRLGLTGAFTGWHVGRRGTSGQLDGDLRPALAAGADAAWDVGPATFDASALGHVDATSIETELDATGSVGVSVDAGGGLVLSASFDRQRRRPTPEELFLEFDHAEVGYRVTGSEDLRAELLHVVRLGARWTGLDDRLSIHGDAWAHRRSRAIETLFDRTVGTVAQYRYGNAGEIESFGANAGVELRDLGVDGSRLYGSWAWLPLTRDRATGLRVPLRAVHAARVGGSVPVWGDYLAISTDVRLTDERSVPAGAPAAPGQVTVDVGLQTRPRDGLRIVAEARNLGDVTDPTWGPIPGREFRIAVDFSLSRSDAPRARATSPSPPNGTQR